MNFKNLFFVPLLFCMSSALRSQVNYKIQGTVHNNTEKNVVHLYYRYPSKGVIHDSCFVKNNVFSFQGYLPELQLGFLVLLPADIDFNSYLKTYNRKLNNKMGVYLENGKILVNIDAHNLENVHISGTANNVAIQDARPLIRQYSLAYDSLTTEIRDARNDSSKMQIVFNKYNNMVENRNDAINKFVRVHPNALASLDLLKRWVDPQINTQGAHTYFEYLSNTIKNSAAGRSYENLVSQAMRVDINSIAPAFQLPDSAGVMHQLNEFKGKYVLLDFWASWCGPCLAEMPSLVNIYNKFKGAKFDIVGISLDGGKTDSKKKWISTFKKESMNWLQLSDLQGQQSAISKDYLITSIPMNYLLNPDGRIIAKGLSPSELEAILQEKIVYN